jgi:hypothetical protein
MNQLFMHNIVSFISGTCLKQKQTKKRKKRLCNYKFKQENVCTKQKVESTEKDATMHIAYLFFSIQNENTISIKN